MPTPLFPLPNTVLFPGERLPLYVFEQRYRQLLNHVQLTGEPFGVVRILYSRQESSLPFHQRLSSYGTLAHLIKANHHEDGTSSIEIVGGERFEVKTLNLTEPYLSAEISLLPYGNPPLAQQETRPWADLLLAGLMRLHPQQAQWIHEHAPSDPLLLATFAVNLLDPAEEVRDEALAASSLVERLKILWDTLPPFALN